ncbi:hypothetical protein SRRS_19250 [Sporomusa rhizae]|uniref:hypothetical protein n=1 Tax=Sporomusa rhizae TaxID=357999 RepID=UPI003529DB34
MYKALDRRRYEMREPFNENELLEMIDNKDIKVLQTSEPLKINSWKLLNDIVFSIRKDIELRVYGFYSQECNLKFVRELVNVERFSADCLMNATEVESIPQMSNLKHLSVDIYNLETFDFLDFINENLEGLSLGRTSSKKPNLKPLKRFRYLKELYIEGQSKNIDVLLELENIEDITLRSISTPDVSYLTNLKKLWSLDVKLGGIKDFSSIKGMDHIKYLELWQIRDLKDLSFMSELEGLQYLFLQSLPQVQELPSFKNLKNLRRILLQNMKGLKDFSKLKEAENLEEFILSEAPSTDPDELRVLLSLLNLKRVACGFGSNKKNNDFKNMLKSKNISDKIDFFNFEFR